MNSENKLIIGTANFLNKYGVFHDNKLNINQINNIQNYKKNKIKFIDTAISYNDCDKVLGKYNLMNKNNK